MRNICLIAVLALGEHRLIEAGKSGKKTLGHVEQSAPTYACHPGFNQIGEGPQMQCVQEEYAPLREICMEGGLLQPNGDCLLSEPATFSCPVGFVAHGPKKADETCLKIDRVLPEQICPAGFEMRGHKCARQTMTPALHVCPIDIKKGHRLNENSTDCFEIQRESPEFVCGDSNMTLRGNRCFGIRQESCLSPVVVLDDKKKTRKNDNNRHHGYFSSHHGSHMRQLGKKKDNRSYENVDFTMAVPSKQKLCDVEFDVAALPVCPEGTFELSDEVSTYKGKYTGALTCGRQIPVELEWICPDAGSWLDADSGMCMGEEYAPLLDNCPVDFLPCNDGAGKDKKDKKHKKKRQALNNELAACCRVSHASMIAGCPIGSEFLDGNCLRTVRAANECPAGFQISDTGLDCYRMLSKPPKVTRAYQVTTKMPSYGYADTKDNKGHKGHKRLH